MFLYKKIAPMDGLQRFRRILAWTGGACCILFASACGDARAQEATVQPSLETVVVTATRREVDVRDVAGAVTVARESDILRQAPDVIAEALRGQPGAFFQQTTPGQGIPIIRGLKGSQVLHLVDGIRLNNAFFRDAPNQYLGLVDPTIVSRIEVLRGAAGSLYGADAMGGVVQVLSREQHFESDATTHRSRLFGSFDSADRGWLTRAEAALGNRRGSLAGGVSWQDRDDRRTGDGETVHPSGFESRAGDLKLLLGAPEDGEWMLSGQVLEQPSTPRVDELVPGFGQDVPAAEQYAFEPNRRSLLHARYRRRADDSWYQALEVHLARQVITDDRITQDFGSPDINTEQNESRLDGLVLQAIHAPAAEWTLTWGVEVYRDDVRSARQSTDADSGAARDVRSRFPDRSSMDSDAVYANLSWSGERRWGVDTGLRWSRFDIRLPKTPDAPAVDLDPDDVTGDLRMRFEVAPDVQLVSNIGRGFRPPNVFDLGALGPRPGNRFNVANPDLGPETVWSYDLGIKAWREGWRLELFAFYLDYQDRITSVATGDTTPDGRIVVRSENRNSVTIHGLEASLEADLGDSLQARLSLNVTRGEETDDRGITTPADRIPPVNGRLALAWKPAAAWRVEPFVGFAARQDRLSPRDTLDPRINPEGTSGWVTLNVHASWHARANLTVGLRLENLLDTSYREHGSGIDAPGFNLGLWLDAGF